MNGSQVFENIEVKKLGNDLIDAISYFSKRNWVPATSSNFSFLHPDGKSIVITQSGKDKNKLNLDDLMWITSDLDVISPIGTKPSAETLIHKKIYDQFNGVKCVLHTHSQFSTLLSRHLIHSSKISFQGLELSKAFPSISTHESIVSLPIVENSQDMNEIWSEFEKFFPGLVESNVGFLISGHGLYAWGDSIFSARRHIEAYEFLLEQTYHEIMLNN